MMVRSGDWFDAGNWDPDVSDAGTDAIIDGKYTVTAASPGGQALSLYMNDAATLTVSSGGAIAVAGSITVGDTGDGTVLNIAGGTYSDGQLVIGVKNWRTGFAVNVSGGTYTTAGNTVIGNNKGVTDASDPL